MKTFSTVFSPSARLSDGLPRLNPAPGKRVSPHLGILVLLGGLALVFAGESRAASFDDSAIWRPRLASPALVALDGVTNRVFTVEVRAEPSTTQWSLVLTNDLRSWKCELESAVYSRINRGTEPGWLLRGRVPGDISPELFNLVVTCSQGAAQQPQAVSVSPAFSDDFYLIHLSDEQIVNEKHTDPSGQYWHTVGTQEEMHWMQEPLNLIHPRLVLVTGDQIDYNGALDGWNNWPNWGYAPSRERNFNSNETAAIEFRLGKMYKECHRGYRIPFVECPGNHDVTPLNKKLKGTELRWHSHSVATYENEFGQRTFSLRMGGVYILMHDWSEPALQAWAAADYQSSLNDPSISFRIVGQHFNTDHAFVPERCDLMLIGHGHTTATVSSSPYFVYEDGPSFSYGKGGFFNFRHSQTGWRCDQTVAQRDVAKDVWGLFTAHGAEKKVRCDQPDSMNLTAHSITITNDLPEDFYDGRVRFIAEQGVYSAVENGVILAQYDCLQGTKTAVLVKVNIPARGSVVVTLPRPGRRS